MGNGILIYGNTLSWEQLLKLFSRLKLTEKHHELLNNLNEDSDDSDDEYDDMCKTLTKIFTDLNYKIKVGPHGECCDRDTTKFVVGLYKTYFCRGDISTPVELLKRADRYKIDHLLSLINVKAQYMLVMNDCDNCT